MRGGTGDDESTIDEETGSDTSEVLVVDDASGGSTRTMTVPAPLHELRSAVLGRFLTADLIVSLLVASSLLVHAATGPSSLLHRAAYLVPIAFAAGSALVGASTAPRGGRRVPWLIALGVTATALGDLVWQVLDAAGVRYAVPVDHPPRVAGFVLLAAAMWVVVARTDPGRRLGITFAVDAATVIVVTGLVLWTVSYGRTLAEGEAPSYVRAVWVAYPVADALLFALVLRVLLSPRARSAIDTAFGVGALVWLASDVAYMVAPMQGRTLLESAWMLAPVLLSRGAWSWAEVEPARTTAGRSSHGWWVALAIAVVPLFVPPFMEVAADLAGRPHSPFLFGSASAALVALAFVRTAELMRSEERVLHELQQAHEEAIAASLAKTRFVAATSHEIRTPLATVMASAEMLDDTELDQDQGDLQRRIRRQGVQLRTLVEDILDFSTIEAGRLELVVAPFDLHQLGSELVETYQHRAADAGLAFEGRIDPCLPQMVVGDVGRLQQVASNLLDNALKFTDEGSVRLEVRHAEHPRQAGRAPDGSVAVDVVVRDSGIGIPADRQHAVFGAFEQVDGSSTRRHGGTGLGLAICRELASLMGGTIRVSSEPGRGSEFVATVRLGIAPQVGAGADVPGLTRWWQSGSHVRPDRVATGPEAGRSAG